MLASLRPARRATRVPPIAAVREGVKLPPGRFAKYRGVGSATLAVLGFLALAYGMWGASGTGPVLALHGHRRRAHLLRGRAVHLAADPAARGRARHPGRSPGRRARDPRARERDPEPAADRLVRGRADDRADAGHARDHAGDVDPRVVLRSGRQDLRRRLRRHRPEQLRPDPGGDRADAPADAGRERRGRRPGRRHAHLRQAEHALRRRPRREQDLPARLDRRLTRGARHARAERRLHGQGLREEAQPPARVPRADPRAERRAADVPDQGDLRPAVGRVAVQRPARDLHLYLRQALHDAAGPVRVLQHQRRRVGREQRQARSGPEGLPQREGAGPRGVQEEPGELPREHPQHPLRAPGAVGDRQPVRDREHAGADDLRADARAGNAAGGRDDPLAGALDGDAGERRHGADRRA